MQFTILKEITFGGLAKANLLNRLTQLDVRFNRYAEELFQHPSFQPESPAEKAQLVKVSCLDLPINTAHYSVEILKGASKLGLKPCPIYLAPFLRLAYLDQPDGPHLTIAAEKPEPGNEIFPSGFYLRNHENHLWLRGYRASDDYEWPADSEFIFRI